MLPPRHWQEYRGSCRHLLCLWHPDNKLSVPPAHGLRVAIMITIQKERGERKMKRHRTTWWVCRMRKAEPLLREEKARRLRRMTRRESFAIFKSLCEAGQLPPENERRRIEKVRMESRIRVRRVMNKLRERE